MSFWPGGITGPFPRPIEIGMLFPAYSLARRNSPVALLGGVYAGLTTRFDQDQMRFIPDLLGHGAKAYRFRGEV